MSYGFSNDPYQPPSQDHTVPQTSQYQTDAENLRLLAVFHYIYGGLSMLCSFFPVLHLGLGIAMVSGAMGPQGRGGPPPELGWIFILIPGLIIVIGVTISSLIILAGMRLTQNRSWGFCFAMAVICCLNVPLGTVLGIFTIIVLVRPTVKERFTSSGGYN
ncbi:MAG: hypothetical protein KDA96_04955 [Planctomycetaceae bacterium]|nr:hypothetical protein [Planctomycetaceae bacterium]